MKMTKAGKYIDDQVLSSACLPRSLHSLPGPARLLIVGRVAAATFWDMLADFVGLGLAPASGMAEVHSQHPLQQAADGSRSLVVRRV
jgi:hypothetical protein